MKKSIILYASLITLISFAFTGQQKSIVGHWQVIVPDTTKLYVDFNRNGTFRNFVSGGALVFEGKYTLNTDTFCIYDKGCGMNYPGRYKLTFSGANSIYFALIEDSCKGRREDIDKSTLKRVTMK